VFYTDDLIGPFWPTHVGCILSVATRHVKPGTIYRVPYPPMISKEQHGHSPLSILPHRTALVVAMRDADLLAVTDWVAGGFSLALLIGLAVIKLGSKPKRVYAPGPPRHPIWGNLFNFPLARWHETFSGWHKSWGMSYSRYFVSYRRDKT
jgi:hypothetical protein